jgi:hypothetical protein
MKLLLENQLINITDNALNEVRRLLLAENPGSGLRLGIKGGGCSGLSYTLEFTEFRDGDTVLDHQGVTVYLDKKSIIWKRFCFSQSSRNEHMWMWRKLLFIKEW